MLQREHSAILLTSIKLPFVIKIFVLSIFEWPFYTGFTVKISPLIVLECTEMRVMRQYALTSHWHYSEVTCWPFV